LTFQLTINQCELEVPKTGFIQASGSPAKSFTGTSKWTLTQYAFIANSTETILELGRTSNSSVCGPLIDDIRVVLVTLPVTKSTFLVVPVISTSLVVPVISTFLVVPVISTSLVVPVTTSTSLKPVTLIPSAESTPINSSPAASPDFSYIDLVQHNNVKSPLIIESSSSPNNITTSSGMSIDKIVSITAGCIGVCLFAGMAIFRYRKYRHDGISDAQVHWDKLMKPR
jgi:hypothetical protein